MTKLRGVGVRIQAEPFEHGMVDEFGHFIEFVHRMNAAALPGRQLDISRHDTKSTRLAVDFAAAWP